MGNVYKKLTSLIGNTPLLELTKIERLKFWSSWNTSTQAEALKTVWPLPWLRLPKEVELCALAAQS